jgi:hypothetical protein
MAAISLFWYTNMAAVMSDENDLYNCLMSVFQNMGENPDIQTAITFDSLTRF